MEEDRVEHGPEDVVLTLVEGAVSGPHRARSVVSREVLPEGLGEVTAAVDPVHDLQRAVLVRLQIGDELHELVRLPIEAQVVQRLEGEGRIPHPAEPVVPVALPTRSLGQRGRERRHRRTGRHVGEALDRQRRALDRIAPAMVWKPRLSQPSPPESSRGGDPRVRIVDVVRRGQALGPRQRAVELLSLLEGVAGTHPVPLDPQRHVGREADGGPGAARVGGVAVVADELPLGRGAPVVERRLADQLDLDLALEAQHRPYQHVLAVLVGRRAGVRRDLVLAPRGAHGQRVEDGGPPGRCLPGRGEDVRSRLVDPGGRHVDPERPQAKVPASRSSSVPNTLGESKRGTHSQSTAPSGATSAPVWQSDRNA